MRRYLQMDTDRLNKWLSLVANLGVIAGIVFLAFEIQQSNQIATAANDIGIRSSYGSANELVAGNPELAEIIFRARDADTEFTGAEREMLESYIARLFNIWMSTERAYERGMASRALLDIALDDLRWTYHTYPALRSDIRENIETYSANRDTEVSQAAMELLEDE